MFSGASKPQRKQRECWMQKTSSGSRGPRGFKKWSEKLEDAERVRGR